MNRRNEMFLFVAFSLLGTHTSGATYSSLGISGNTRSAPEGLYAGLLKLPELGHYRTDLLQALAIKGGPAEAAITQELKNLGCPQETFWAKGEHERVEAIGLTIDLLIEESNTVARDIITHAGAHDKFGIKNADQLHPQAQELLLGRKPFLDADIAPEIERIEHDLDEQLHPRLQAALKLHVTEAFMRDFRQLVSHDQEALKAALDRVGELVEVHPHTDGQPTTFTLSAIGNLRPLRNNHAGLHGLKFNNSPLRAVLHFRPPRPEVEGHVLLLRIAAGNDIHLQTDVGRALANWEANLGQPQHLASNIAPLRSVIPLPDSVAQFMPPTPHKSNGAAPVKSNGTVRKNQH